MGDIAAIESRIWSILEPYRADLVPSTIYGMPALAWPGAKSHDYFAAVKPAKTHVGVYLIVADAFPEALEGTSQRVLKRRTGKAAFTFPELDDEMARDFEQLIARLYDRYRAAHADV